MSFEDIIRIVQERPEIWQFSHPLYHNKSVKKRIWRQISKELHTDETLIKKRWKHLMDQYRKEFKKMENPKTFLGEPVPCTWVHYESLAFLNEEMAMRKERDKSKINAGSESDENHQQEEATEDYDNILWKYQTQPNQPAQNVTTERNSSITKADLILKRLQNVSSLLAKTCQREDLRNDEDYMFFMSVLPMVRNMSVVKKLQFRMKVNAFLLQSIAETDPLNNVQDFEPEDCNDEVMKTENNDC